MALEEGRGTGLASSALLFIHRIMSHVPTGFPAHLVRAGLQPSSPLFLTCLGSQTWIFPSTSAEPGGFTPLETMERDSHLVSASVELGPEPPGTEETGMGLEARWGSGSVPRFQGKLNVPFPV